MVKYRIDFFTGPFVYDSLIKRVYRTCACIDDAIVYAKSEARKIGHNFWNVLEVNE